MPVQSPFLNFTQSHRVAYTVGCSVLLLSLVALLNAPANLAVTLLHDRVLGVHIVLELFAIVVAVLIATASWNMLKLRQDPAAGVMLLGFMIVACCDLMHMLTFKGMPTFITQSDPERGIFFWLIGRTVEVLTLLCLAFGRIPSLPRSFALTSGVLVSAAVVWVGSFHLDVFPRTFIEGVGLTPFKANFEYALSALHLLTALLLARRAAQTGANQFRLLAMSSLVMGVGELSFTSYLGMSDFQTHAGHIYKVLAYVLLYRSIYTINVLAPMVALQAAERDLRQVLDALPSMVGYCDRNLINRIANKAFGDWFGVDGAHMPGRHVRELLGESSYLRTLPFIEAALRGEPQAFEATIPTPDGRGVRHAFTHFLPDWQAGKVVGFYFLVHDVSALNQAVRAQRETLAELTEERQRLDNILRGADVGTWDWDIPTGALRIDDRWAGILGYASSELQPHIDIRSELAHPAELGVSRTKLREHLSGQAEMYDMECRLRHRDGHWVWVLDRGRVSSRDEQGRALRIQGTLLDISKAKLAQAQLAEREAFLERVSEVAEVGGWQFDLKTNAVTFSKQACRISRVAENFRPTLEEALAFYTEASRALIRKAVRDAIEQHKAFDWELPCHSAQGEPLWVRVVGEAVYDDDTPGALPTRLIGAMQNISERNRAAQDLQRANERLALAVGSAGMGVWDYDVQARTLSWDEQMYALYGESPSGGAEPYTLWSDRLHPDDRLTAEQALGDAMKGKHAFKTQFRIRRADNTVRHLRAAAHVARDASGAPLRMFGVNMDVTEQVNTAAALQENQQLLQRVGSLAAIGGWRVDIKAGSVHWSEQTRRIHEVPPDYVPDLASSISFYVPEHRVLIEQAVRQGMERGESWDLELRLITHKGRSIWVRALGEVEFENGQPAHLVGAIQDITGRREAEELLRATMVAAEAANAAKSAFLSNMSHEIRTPLNAVIGVAHLLADSELDEDQRHLVSKAQIAGRSLLDIVNDVLDLAKIEAGEMELDEVVFQPAKLLAELHSVYGTQAQTKGLALTVQGSIELPTWLFGDSNRLRQILTNLISNALKFTGKGGVSVLMSVVSRDDSSLLLRASVRDTGVGIEPEAQARLFQPFIQADVSTTRHFGGTGLGLSIVRRLSLLMRGEAGLNSCADQGSEFWVEVPMIVPSPEQTAYSDNGLPDTAVDGDPMTDATLLRTVKTSTLIDAVNSSLAMPDGIRELRAPSTHPSKRSSGELLDVQVLVVDDTDINLEITRRLLERQGAEVHTCSSGREALELLSRQSLGLDLVLMDVQMPHMDGLEVTRRIRGELGLTALPIVALTAGALTEERKRALAAGMDDFLTKPLDPKELVRMIRAQVGRRSQLKASLSPVDPVEEVSITWPVMTGIDNADAQSRLGGDWKFFISILQRLFREYKDLMTVPAIEPASDERAVLAARLHKLRGSSGTIGATQVHRLATELEDLLVSTDAQALPGLQALAAELGILDESAKHTLTVEKADVTSVPPLAADPSLTAADLQGLMDLLKDCDLAAMDRFDELQEAVIVRLGVPEAESLCSAIRSLEFDRALRILGTISRS
jgi:PAS domain S-box-containing protein